VPESEERHYQQSAGLAIGAGFLTIFVIGFFSDSNDVHASSRRERVNRFTVRHSRR
jgi:hypothetical protein